MELNTDALLSVPIKDNEIYDLLERLAATEEMFKAQVSTIRDVAELTEASPDLIARLLGEMRGPGEYEKIIGRLDEHDARLREVEQKFSKLEKQASVPKEPKINRPNIVGSTIESGRKRAPRVQEPPPAAWVENKRNIEVARHKYWEKKTDEFHAGANRYLTYVALVIFVTWILYLVLTSPVSPPPNVPIIR